VTKHESSLHRAGGLFFIAAAITKVIASSSPPPPWGDNLTHLPPREKPGGLSRQLTLQGRGRGRGGSCGGRGGGESSGGQKPDVVATKKPVVGGCPMGVCRWGSSDLMEHRSFWGSGGGPLRGRPDPKNGRCSIKSVNPHRLNLHRAAAEAASVPDVAKRRRKAPHC
jgi:hypothetical protein